MSKKMKSGPYLRWPFLILGVLSLLVFSAGAECDSEARASFRAAATGPIGDGVKSILNGILDGAIAAIEEAGDGSSADDSGTSN